MRSPNKSRSRNKNQNRRSSANIVNRVFDSSGPDGKVRGTPQQIIDKYHLLARDAQLSGDRVAAENFQQHAEHYIRLLNEAMREQNQRREQQEAQRREQQQQADARAQQHQQKPPVAIDPRQTEQPEIPDSALLEARGEVAPVVADSGLVETPEGKARRRGSRSSGRQRAKPAGDSAGGATGSAEDGDESSDGSATGEEQAAQ